MAKKARKKSAAKRGKKSKAVKKAKHAAKKKTGRKTKKAKHASIGQQLSSGYHIVVDTVTGTEKLRKKLEKPGTDETE